MTWMLYDPCACGNDQVDALAKAAAQDGFVAPTYAPEDDFADAVRVRGRDINAGKRVRRDVSGVNGVVVHVVSAPCVRVRGRGY